MYCSDRPPRSPAARQQPPARCSLYQPVIRKPAVAVFVHRAVPVLELSAHLSGYRTLGGLCRTHHILKHHPDWKLRQITPGTFTWTTPAGRTYTSTPDTHPL
jgi:hypothetical protein